MYACLLLLHAATTKLIWLKFGREVDYNLKDITIFFLLKIVKTEIQEDGVVGVLLVNIIST